MLAPPGSGPRRTGAGGGTSSARRKIQESTDDAVRRMQRTGANKRCADCQTKVSNDGWSSCGLSNAEETLIFREAYFLSIRVVSHLPTLIISPSLNLTAVSPHPNFCIPKLPTFVNQTHGTFVCMACSGVHREFNHRIKGIGHSSFSADEVAGLSEAGNAAVNAMFMAGYSSSGERLRPPENNHDQQLLRVWIRRKYVDKAWYKSQEGDKGEAATAPAGGGGSASAAPQRQHRGHGTQATRVKIPPAKPAPAKPAVSAAAPMDLLGFDCAPPPAPAPPAPAAAVSAQPQRQQQWDAFSGISGGSNFDTAFGQVQSPPQQQPQQPQQQQQSMFNDNFAQQGQQQQQPVFNASFQQYGQQQQQMLQGQLTQQEQPVYASASQQGQQHQLQQGQQASLTQQVNQQPGFNANFSQQGQQQQILPGQQQSMFKASFSQQEPQQQPPQQQHLIHNSGLSQKGQEQYNPHGQQFSQEQQREQQPMFNANFSPQKQQEHNPQVAQMPPGQPQMKLSSGQAQVQQTVEKPPQLPQQDGFGQAQVQGLQQSTSHQQFVSHQQPPVPPTPLQQPPIPLSPPPQHPAITPISTDVNTVDEKANKIDDAFSGLSVEPSMTTNGYASQSQEQGWEGLGVPGKVSPVVSKFKEGQKAIYRNRENNRTIVTIIKMHLDDEVRRHPSTYISSLLEFVCTHLHQIDQIAVASFFIMLIYFDFI